MILYLSAPYTDPDPARMAHRAELIAHATALLMEERHIVFSPVTHGAGVAPYLSGEKSHAWWMEQCRGLFDVLATRRDFVVWVLPLPGWQQSRGVVMEMSWAKASGHPFIIDTDLYSRVRVRSILQARRAREARS